MNRKFLAATGAVTIAIAIFAIYPSGQKPRGIIAPPPEQNSVEPRTESPRQGEKSVRKELPEPKERRPEVAFNERIATLFIQEFGPRYTPLDWENIPLEAADSLEAFREYERGYGILREAFDAEHHGQKPWERYQEALKVLRKAKDIANGIERRAQAKRREQTKEPIRFFTPANERAVNIAGECQALIQKINKHVEKNK